MKSDSKAATQSWAPDVKERDSGDIMLYNNKQSRSHYQGLSKGGALIERYLLMQRMVY